MSNYHDFKIELAKLEHLSQILTVAQKYNLEQMSPTDAAELGFLVSDFQEADYRDFLRRANHFYIVLENENVCGFVLAYSNDRIQENEWLNLRIQSRHSDPFIVIKQICIRPDLIGTGLATLLYQHLFNQTQGCPLFTAIVLEPLNNRSVVFHEKRGFKKVFQITPPDGMLRGVWMRKPVIDL